ncbi:4Fe-4S dicluster domain-containing protein [bacterium]|nr:4Fe-4S dicluster domain-containing protein [bacterium]
METLKKRAKELLESKQVDVVLGYAAGPGGKARPVFIKDPAQTDTLILPEDNQGLNLAVYLTKPELKKIKKMAIMATVPIRRTLLQYLVENQLDLDRVIILAIDRDMPFKEMTDVAALEQSVNAQEQQLTPEQRQQLEAIERMSPQERFDYWTSQLSACIKCYACRAACPLCYCERCVVEDNRPQWIPVASHTLGNIEWHINRAMHLAGRCINCGACRHACPLNLPIDLLTQKMADVVFTQFNEQAGVSASCPYSLGTFKNEDKEDFIG